MSCAFACCHSRRPGPPDICRTDRVEAVRAPLTPNQVYSLHIYISIGNDRKKRLADWQALSARQNVPLWNGEFAMIQTTIAMFDSSLFALMLH